MATLIPLGTAGWMPTSTRQTACYALEIDDRLILLDLGTGISRLGSDIGQALLSKYQEVTILLSHYHLDHIVGLCYLPRFFSGKRVTLCGPGRAVYGTSMDVILDRICSSPFFSSRLTAFPLSIELQEIVPGLNQIGGLSVQAWLQEHSDLSLGFRVHDIVYITDTGYSHQLSNLCMDCVCLLHEAMLDTDGLREATADRARTAEHSDAIAAALLADRVKAGMLVLIHLNPAYSEKRLLSMLSEAQRIFNSTALSYDLHGIAL